MSDSAYRKTPARLRDLVPRLLACLTLGHAVAQENRGLTAADVMTSDEKSRLEACVARAAESAGDGQERRAIFGVFIGEKGRAVNLAILESSGLEQLDKRVLRCLLQATYIPATPRNAPIQWFFTTLLKPKRPTTARDTHDTVRAGKGFALEREG